MVNELSALVWTDDLFSGRSLPLLLNIHSSKPDFLVVLCIIPIGGLLPVLFQWATRNMQSSRPLMWPHAAHITLQCFSAAVKLGTNISTLFACAHDIEPYVGAILCIVPALTLMCLKGIEHNKYVNYMRLFMTFSALALLIYSCLTSEGRAADALSEPTWWLYVRILINSAYACNDLNAKAPINVLIRIGVYIAVSSTASVLSSLTTCHSSLLGFFIKTVLLMQSSMVHSGTIKQCLGKLGLSRQSRTHLIVVAGVTATGFTFKEHIATDASIAVAILYVLNACTGLLEYIDGRKSAIPML